MRAVRARTQSVGPALSRARGVCVHGSEADALDRNSGRSAKRRKKEQFRERLMLRKTSCSYSRPTVFKSPDVACIRIRGTNDLYRVMALPQYGRGRTIGS